MRIEPVDIGRFHLEFPDSEAARDVASTLPRYYSDRLELRNEKYISCGSYAEHERKCIYLAVLEDGDPIGVFYPYNLKTESFDGTTRRCSAMPAPALPSLDVGSDNWNDTVVLFLDWFLKNDVVCENGEILRITKWVFPTVETGHRHETEWNHRNFLESFVSAVIEAGLDCDYREEDRTPKTVSLGDE